MTFVVGIRRSPYLWFYNLGDVFVNSTFFSDYNGWLFGMKRKFPPWESYEGSIPPKMSCFLMVFL